MILGCTTEFQRTAYLVSCYRRFNVQGNALCQPGLMSVMFFVLSLLFPVVILLITSCEFFVFQALLSGCSAGGLAAILHCDEFRGFFPRNTKVKCLSDAGLFLDS